MRILPITLLLTSTFSLSAHADTQKPSTVSGVQASALSSSAISLTWSTPWDNVGVDGYNIYRNGSYYSTLFNATNFIDQNLSSGTRYEYSVVAFDQARNYSTLSAASSATTSGSGSSSTSSSTALAAAPPSDNGTPAAPSNLSAQVLGSSSVKLQWNAPSGSVSGYNIYQDGAYHQTIRGSQEYTASSLSSGREYSWQVVAFNGQNYSLKSSTVRATTEQSSSSPSISSFSASSDVSSNNGVPSGYNLVFSEDFQGGSLDSSKWSSRYRWGPWWTINNEQQFYVDSLNVPDFGHTPFSFDGANLTISASETPDSLRGSANNKPYLSGTLTTYGKFSMRYGYVEMRARMPKGKGLWPAFWLLHNHENGNRPEIDVVEMLGDQTNLVYHTYHYYDNGTLRSTPSYQYWGSDFSADFHTFGMKWEPGTITWYVDGQVRNTYSNNSVPSEDMYLLVNLAVGGAWAGSPDSSTSFPAEYTIDYIRAYTAD